MEKVFAHPMTPVRAAPGTHLRLRLRQVVLIKVVVHAMDLVVERTCGVEHSHVLAEDLGGKSTRGEGVAAHHLGR